MNLTLRQAALGAVCVAGFIEIPKYYHSCVVAKNQIGWSSRNVGALLESGFHPRIPLFEELFVVNRVDDVKGFDVVTVEPDGQNMNIFHVKDFDIEIVEGSESCVKKQFLDYACADDAGLMQFEKAGDGSVKKFFVDGVKSSIGKLHRENRAVSGDDVQDAIRVELSQFGYRLCNVPMTMTSDRVSRQTFFGWYRHL